MTHGYKESGVVSSEKARRFVLLDRDGTVIEECHYLSDPDQVKLIPGSAAALRILREQGLGLVIVTNQSGVGRGYFDLRRLGQINQRMCELLEAEGVTLDGIYFCPHTPDEACNCRKPRPGMVEQAAAELGFDPTQCMMIGDRDTDIGLGQSVDAITILVSTGYGTDTANDGKTNADHSVSNLLEAAELIADLVLVNNDPVTLN